MKWNVKRGVNREEKNDRPQLSVIDTLFCLTGETCETN